MTTHQIFLSPGALLLAKQQETIAHELLLLRNNLFLRHHCLLPSSCPYSLRRSQILTFGFHVLLRGDQRSQEPNVAQLISDTAAEAPLCWTVKENVMMLLSDVPSTIPFTPPLFGWILVSTAGLSFHHAKYNAGLEVPSLGTVTQWTNTQVL